MARKGAEGGVGIGGIVLCGFRLSLGGFCTGKLAANQESTEPMFVSLYVTLGIFLLLAARNPSAHRSLIALAAWANIAHAAVMAVMAIHIARERSGLLIAAAVFGAIGTALIVLAPAKQLTQRVWSAGGT